MSILNILPIIIIISGFYFIIKLRAFYIIHPVKTVKTAITAIKKSPSTRKSFILALSGTLGVGNIVGVAFGISVGGAGVLFWIIISAVFSCALKYAESTLAADTAEDGSGGMMYLLKSSYKKHGKMLGSCYAVLCLLLSLFMGSALQARTLIETASVCIPIKKGVFACLLVFLTFGVVVGGVGKIEKATVMIIPLATAVYVVLCIALICINASRLPSVIASVFSSAFTPRSAAGGAISFLFSRAFKEGFSRGLLSNEAGAGTSAIAESRSERAPHEVGVFGLLEVLFDTVLLCTLTGLAMLSSGAPLEKEGMSIIISAFTQLLGKATAPVFTLLIFAFAYSSIICSYFYGSEALKFLLRRESGIYIPVFLLFLILGAYLSYDILIYTTDYILLFMTLLTLCVLIKKTERLKSLSESLIFSQEFLCGKEPKFRLPKVRK